MRWSVSAGNNDFSTVPWIVLENSQTRTPNVIVCQQIFWSTCFSKDLKNLRFYYLLLALLLTDKLPCLRLWKQEALLTLGSSWGYEPLKCGKPDSPKCGRPDSRSLPILPCLFPIDFMKESKVQRCKWLRWIWSLQCEKLCSGTWELSSAQRISSLCRVYSPQLCILLKTHS